MNANKIRIYAPKVIIDYRSILNNKVKFSMPIEFPFGIFRLFL